MPVNENTMPYKAFSRARKGYEKVSQRSGTIFYNMKENHPVQQAARELEDALEDALLANEERGLPQISVRMPEALNEAFTRPDSGVLLATDFIMRVNSTLGIPRPFMTLDTEKRLCHVRII